MELKHDFAPEAERVGFVENKIEAAADGSPFALEDLPCRLGGGGDLGGFGMAVATFRSEVGNLGFDQRADEPEVVTSGGEDAVAALGVPAGDAVFELGRAVEVDFLGALDRPVLEDAVAARRGEAWPWTAGESGPPLCTVRGTMPA